MTGIFTMYDDVDVGLLPPGAPAYAGYVDGRFANVAAIHARFPSARILTIAVFAGDDAECLDVEPGDATNAQVYGWFKRQLGRKVWRPCLYTSVSNIDAIVATMNANKFSRSSYRLWSAHYGRGPHICGPSSCGLCRTPCDATQWTSSALGRSLDQSECLSDFFGGSAPPPPPPPGTWTAQMIKRMPVKEQGMKDGSGAGRYIARIQGLCTALGSATSIDGDFGSGTATAVKHQQASGDVAQDGIVGPDTWGWLVCGSGGGNTPGNLGTYQAGDTDGSGHGRYVKRIQALCTALGNKIAIDGDFGPATEAAVKAQQKDFSLTQDGIVGRHTWSALVAGTPG